MHLADKVTPPINRSWQGMWFNVSSDKLQLMMLKFQINGGAGGFVEVQLFTRFLSKPHKKNNVACICATGGVATLHLISKHGLLALLIYVHMVQYCLRLLVVLIYCYANSSGCPLPAELISSYLYSLTKPCTTTRQCICVNL